VAEAVRYYAPHSFSVQTSKKKLTLAKHVYVSVQPLSHSWPLLGQLVHVSFLTPAPWQVWGGSRVCGRGCALLCATLIFSADQQEKAHSSKACLCQCATFRLI
jgi:hypothetical protein